MPNNRGAGAQLNEGRRRDRRRARTPWDTGGHRWGPTRRPCDGAASVTTLRVSHAASVHSQSQGVWCAAPAAGIWDLRAGASSRRRRASGSRLPARAVASRLFPAAAGSLLRCICETSAARAARAKAPRPQEQRQRHRAPPHVAASAAASASTLHSAAAAAGSNQNKNQSSAARALRRRAARCCRCTCICICDAGDGSHVPGRVRRSAAGRGRNRIGLPTAAATRPAAAARPAGRSASSVARAGFQRRAAAAAASRARMAPRCPCAPMAACAESSDASFLRCCVSSERQRARGGADGEPMAYQRQSARCSDTLSIQQQPYIAAAQRGPHPQRQTLRSAALLAGLRREAPEARQAAAAGARTGAAVCMLRDPPAFYALLWPRRQRRCGCGAPQAGTAPAACPSTAAQRRGSHRCSMQHSTGCSGKARRSKRMRSVQSMHDAAPAASCSAVAQAQGPRHSAQTAASGGASPPALALTVALRLVCRCSCRL